MNRRISNEGIVILVMVLLVLLVFFVPVENLIGKPSILGKVISKVYIKPLEVTQNCNVTLAVGWNLMSIACEPDNVSVIDIMIPIIGNYTSVHGYNKSASLDKWNSYNPSMPWYVVQDLGEISNEKGYWINMANASFFTVSGAITVPHKIPLTTGWELVGYPSNISNIPGTAWTTIDGSYSIAWTYNTSSATYLYYNPNLGSGTIAAVIPGYGYWINMTQNDDWWIS